MQGPLNPPADGVAADPAPSPLAHRLRALRAVVGRELDMLRLKREINALHAELGRPTVFERVKSIAAVGAALVTGFTLKLDLFQHPRLRRNVYRMPGSIWEEIPKKFYRPDF